MTHIVGRGPPLDQFGAGRKRDDDWGRVDQCVVEIDRRDRWYRGFYVATNEHERGDRYAKRDREHRPRGS